MSLRHDIEAARQHVLTTLTRSTPRSKIIFCQASPNRRTRQILPTPGPVQMHGPPSAPQISSGPPVYLQLGSKRSTKTKWPNTRDLNTQHMGCRSDPSRPSPSRVGRWLIGFLSGPAITALLSEPRTGSAPHCYVEAPLDLFRCDFADTTAVSAAQRGGERMTGQVRTRCPRRALPRVWRGGAASGVQGE
jgi:hypothetical protein